jgi:hypothetical protein
VEDNQIKAHIAEFAEKNQVVKKKNEINSHGLDESSPHMACTRGTPPPT